MKSLKNKILYSIEETGKTISHLYKNNNCKPILILMFFFLLSFSIGYVTETAVLGSVKGAYHLTKDIYENLNKDVDKLVKDKDNLIKDKDDLVTIYEDLEKTKNRTVSTLENIWGHLKTALEDIQTTGKHVEKIADIPGEVMK